MAPSIVRGRPTTYYCLFAGYRVKEEAYRSIARCVSLFIALLTPDTVQGNTVPFVFDVEGFPCLAHPVNRTLSGVQIQDLELSSFKVSYGGP